MSYTRSDLKAAINAGIKNKSGVLVDFNNLVNRAVREVITEVDVRSSKRRAAVAQGLFNDTYEYPAPADLKGYGVIDIAPQVGRERNTGFSLVSVEEFDRRKEDYTFAVDHRDNDKRLLISAPVDDDTLIVDTLDSDTNWSSFGEGENIDANARTYVKGSASVEFDVSSTLSETQAGIQNSAVTQFDLTDYLNGSAFVWAYLPQTTNVTGFTIRLGNDSSNYYSQSVTASAADTPLVEGWNLLRFDLDSATEVGAVTNDECDYVVLILDKAEDLVSVTGFRFDHIILKNSVYYNVLYYSKYPWRDSTGTYLENSTSDTDILSADTDEYNLFVTKGIELAAAEVEEGNIEVKSFERYTLSRDGYTRNNPSEAKYMTTTYYDF